MLLPTLLGHLFEKKQFDIFPLLISVLTFVPLLCVIWCLMQENRCQKMISDFFDVPKSTEYSPLPTEFTTSINNKHNVDNMCAIYDSEMEETALSLIHI